MEDLKCISYDALKKLIDSIKEFDDEVDAIASSSHECIRLWENDHLNSPYNAIVDYLDSILYEEVGYFVYECRYGTERFKGEPLTIEAGDKEYPITDFDSWYAYLLDMEAQIEDEAK